MQGYPQTGVIPIVFSHYCSEHGKLDDGTVETTSKVCYFAEF